MPADRTVETWTNSSSNKDKEREQAAAELPAAEVQQDKATWLFERTRRDKGGARNDFWQFKTI